MGITMPELSQHFAQNIEQTLELHLSPRMLAMLRTLQLPYTDLVAELERESEENPTLEIERPEALTEYLRYLESDRKLKKQVDFDEYPGIENIRNISRSLEQHLLEQLKLENLEEEAFKIGEYMIQNLEPSGYIKDYEKIKAEIREKYGAEEDQVEEVLRIIQAFEPEGVGARDLRECLLIQVREYNFDNFELQEILEQAIDKHLEDLGQKKHKTVAEALGISESGVAEIASFIRENLNPNPGANFGEEPQHVIPSFAIEREDDKIKFVNLEEKYGPRLRISREYEKMLKDKKTDAETVKFLKEKFQRAKDLMENIMKRGETSGAIVKIITETQTEFFRKGAAQLMPLMQKELADKLGLHPSTISRAISGKYIQTPQGLLPLKYLCPRELHGSTPTRIKSLLLDILANEDKQHPFSDDQLADLLQKQGVQVKRRTLASYRKELGFPSFSEREQL
jgi:RNA polymerase sigma-54 factor